MNNKLKKILILIATILVLTWFWSYFIKYRAWDIRIPVKPEMTGPEYEFKHIALKEISGELTFFNLNANKVEIAKDKAGLINISGNILSNNKPALYFESNTAQLNFNQQTALLSVFYGRTIKNEPPAYNKRKKNIPSQPWQVKASSALWNQQRNTITLNKPLKLWNQEITIIGDKLIYYSNYEIFVIGPNCEITNPSYNISCRQAVLKDKLDTLTMEDNIIFNGQYFNGRADRLDINYKTKEYVFLKNVILEYENTAINTDLATAKLNTDIIEFQDNVKLIYKNILVHSNRAILNRSKNTIEFFENIKAWRDQSQIEGEKMIFDLKEKKFISTGGRTKIIKSNSDAED